MALLLDDLLDVSRITRGKLELRKERVELAQRGRELRSRPRRPLIERRRHTADRDAAGASRLHARCRSAAAGAGVREPAQQRREVHRRRAASIALAAARDGDRRRDLGRGHRASASSPETIAATCSRCSRRSTARSTARRAASASGWPGEAAGRAARRHGRSAQRRLGRGSEFIVRLPTSRAERRQHASGAARTGGKWRARAAPARSWLPTTTATRPTSLACCCSCQGYGCDRAFNGPQALRAREQCPAESRCCSTSACLV